MDIALYWFMLSIAVGVIASFRDRGGFGWFILAMLISPLIAGILIFALPSRMAVPGAPSPDTHVKCPDCKELVLAEARVCKHCGCRLVPVSEQGKAAPASTGPLAG